MNILWNNISSKTMKNRIYYWASRALRAHLLFHLWTFSICIHYKTKTNFIKKCRGYSEIEFCKRLIFENSIVNKPSLGSPRVPQKILTKRFSRFDVFWIQTDRQTNRQGKYLCRLFVEDTRMKIRLTVCELNAGNIKPVVVIVVVYFTNVYVFICIRPWA